MPIFMDDLDETKYIDYGLPLAVKEDEPPPPVLDAERQAAEWDDGEDER